MNQTITAYAPIIDIVCMNATDYQVIDAPQSVGKKYPVVVGYVNIIRGFIHYTGASCSTHEGVYAVIEPSYPLEDGGRRVGDYKGAIEYALKNGLRSGRRDDQ